MLIMGTLIFCVQFKHFLFYCSEIQDLHVVLFTGKISVYGNALQIENYNGL